jgi:hypothetical protein
MFTKQFFQTRKRFANLRHCGVLLWIVNGFMLGLSPVRLSLNTIRNDSNSALSNESLNRIILGPILAAGGSH